MAAVDRKSYLYLPGFHACYNFPALELLKNAIGKAGYTDKIVIGMDVAASEFFRSGKYDLDFKSPDDPSRYISPDELANLYKSFIKDYPGEYFWGDAILLQPPMGIRTAAALGRRWPQARQWVGGVHATCLPKGALPVYPGLHRGACSEGRSRWGCSSADWRVPLMRRGSAFLSGIY